MSSDTPDHFRCFPHITQWSGYRHSLARKLGEGPRGLTVKFKIHPTAFQKCQSLEGTEFPWGALGLGQNILGWEGQ